MIKKLKAKIKNVLYTLIGKSLFLNKKVIIDYQWIGNDYGGFYIHPHLLNSNSIIYSFGIGEDISFDFDIISNFNCHVYAFDPTPKSIKWVNDNVKLENFEFFPFGISIVSGKETFYLPKNSNFVSGSIYDIESVNKFDAIEVPMKNFSDITKGLNHSIIDILKMDIEGAEYEILVDILRVSSVTVKQICVEFHHRMFKNGAVKTKEIIQKLEENGFLLFAFSETHEELSFINTKFLKLTV